MNVACGQCGQVVAVADNAPAGAVIRCPRCTSPIEIQGVARTTPHAHGAAPRAAGHREGQTLGGFLLEREIGRGGMGVVYKARQLSLGRTVAVKVLPEDLTASDELTARFVREAGAMALLNHPNIVAIYDKGIEAGTYYFAMEFVEGHSLREIIRSRRLSPEEAVAILAPVLEALAHAHARGIVHRDLKPENVMVDPQGRPKVMDFGIAHLFGTAESPTLTRTRAFMGTLHYMAPEQAGMAGSVDGRADLYAAGVILYEMLTGSVPLGAFRPPSQVVPGLDPGFDHIVISALQAAPADRYASADDMLHDLAMLPAAAGARVGIRTPTPRPGGPTPRPSTRPGTDLRTIPSPTIPAPTWPTAATAPDAPPRRGGGLGVLLVGLVVVAGLAAIVLGGGFLLMMQLADDSGPSGHTGPSPSPTRGAARTPPPTRVATETAVPVSRPSAGTIRVSNWSAQVKGLRFFEGPDEHLPLEQRAYRTRFPRHSSRYVWWELELAYKPPSRKIEFQVKWQIEKPNGTTTDWLENGFHLSPDEESTYYAAGWGGTFPASWWPGTHKVNLFIDGKHVASGSFDMYREEIQAEGSRRKTLQPAVKIGGVRAEVTELLFYESGPGSLDLAKRVYGTSFQARDARFVNWHLELLYGTIKEKKPFSMVWVLTNGEGEELARLPNDYFLDPTSTATFHSAGWGAENRGTWQPGIYTVDGYMGDLKVVTASFEMD